ncbi:MAG TPA: GNAT family N-acetyltransferase, partial [bacterium]|nr:GNAT family N-acetyltransferase [bacterium]
MIETKRLILRPIQATDFDSLYAYGSMPKVYRYVVLGPFGEKDTKNFIQYAIAQGKKKPVQRYVWAVTLKKTGQLIGDCNFNIKNQILREACIGYTLHPNFWGQGYATEMTKKLIEFGFKKLKMHRIFATCDRNNTASNKVLLKAGMKWEGTFRKNMLQKGKWRDTNQY